MIQSDAIKNIPRDSATAYIKASSATATKNTALAILLLFSVATEFMIGYEKPILIAQFIIASGLLWINNRSLSRLEKGLAVLCAVFILIEIILYHDYGSSLTYANSVLLILCFNNMALRKRQLSKLFILCSMVILLIIITSSRDGIEYVLITGNRYNPNMIGMFLFASLVLGFSGISYLTITKNTKRVLYIVLFLLVIFLQLQTEARTSLIAEIAYVVLVIMRHKLKFFNKERRFKMLVIIGFMLCLLIPVIYVALYNYVDGQSIVILGKNLFTGRQNVWSDAFSMIGRNPIFGVGNEELFMGVYASAHNSLLAIWKTSGGILLIIYIISCVSYKSKKTAQFEVNLFMRYAIIPVIFIAAFETILTDSHLYIMALLPLLNKTIASKKAYGK